ncbi:MAG: penicillin-binding protein [Longicatena sp.]|nr:penicillin-binding protein [Longicatena sp.]
MDLKKSNQYLVVAILIMLLTGTLVCGNVLFVMVSKTHLHSGENIIDNYVDVSSYTKITTGYRGTIYDRNGEKIAEDVDTYSIYLHIEERWENKYVEEQLEQTYDKNGNPEPIQVVVKKVKVPLFVHDETLTASKLATQLDLSAKEILKMIKDGKKNNLVQIELGEKGRKLSVKVKDAIVDMKLPGVYFTKEIKRAYTENVFASHLLGFAKYNEDEKRVIGQSGLESTLDSELKGKNGKTHMQIDVESNILPGTEEVEEYSKNGNDVYLTLDRNVQLTLQSALEKTQKETNARRAWGIVMEVDTGKVLGWSSLPSYNLEKLDIKDYLDVNSMYLYEPGSVMKGITYAAAIDSGVYPFNQEYRAGAFYYRSEGDKIIRTNSYESGLYPPIFDAMQRDYGVLTFDDGFARSSNIAICELLANHLNPKVYLEYIKKFGFLNKVDMDYVDNEEGGIQFEKAIEILNTGFGQGVSVTALQMAQAYTAIFNDGEMVVPYVVDRIVDSETKEVIKQYEKKVAGNPIKKETSEYMRKLMRRVVEDEIGTAHYRYDMTDVDVIAKTGTGQIIENGVYGNTYTSSVMAAAPGDDPKVMIYYCFESKEYLNYTGDPFKEVMKAALVACNITGEDIVEDEEPKNIEEWNEYEVPSYMNHSLDYALSKLEKMNVQVVVIGDGEYITAQYPNPQEQILSGNKVYLYTSGTTISMPSFNGWTKKELNIYSVLTGIKIEMSGSGIVKSQNIAKDTKINKDTIIKVKLE